MPLSGALLSLEKLNRLEIRAGVAVAGPGVLLADLHAAAAATGQFYPPDPTETSASIGGTIATSNLPAIPSQGGMRASSRTPQWRGSTAIA